MKINPSTEPLEDKSMPTRPPVFVSSHFYALGRELGFEAANAELVADLESPSKDSLPAVRTIHRLRQLNDIRLFLDIGATCIGKARSRAFHEAYESGCPAWVTLDDDVEVTAATCSSLLEALDENVPRVVVVPFMTRAPTGGARLNITLPTVRIEREFRGAKLLKLASRSHGFGMVGMNRLAMVEVVDAARELVGTEHDLEFVDDDGRMKLALFHEMIGGKRWLGEDFSFFQRVPRDVSVEALLVGTSLHGGLPLDLGKL